MLSSSSSSSSLTSTMHVGQTACERIDSVARFDSEEHDGDDVVSPDSVIPKQGSVSESWQLRKLRAIQAQHSADERSSEGSNGGGQRLITSEKDSDQQVVETELYWSGKRLIWSRSGIALRLFSFDEQIRCACWAWLEVDGMWENEASAVGSPSARATPAPQRALCVFLRSRLLMHFPHSGMEYVKRLDFKVARAFALDIGLIIQRLVEREDVRRSAEQREKSPRDEMMDDEADLSRMEDKPLPTMFYIRRPYDDFRAVQEQGRIPGELDNFESITQEVIYVGQTDEMKDKECAVLVTADRQYKRLQMYSLSHSSASINVSVTRGSALADDNETNGRRPSMPRKSSVRSRVMSGRSSSTAARKSLAAGRSRLSSVPSHRMSMGLGLSSLPNSHPEEEAQMTYQNDEDGHEDIDDVMQLLDDLDEAAEQNEPAVGRTPNPRASLKQSRRTSRHHSQHYSNLNASTRTPLRSTSTVIGEERRVQPRPRTTSTTHNGPANMAIQTPSMAARLTRSDDKSKQTQATQERPDLLRRRSGMTTIAIPMNDANDVATNTWDEVQARQPTAFFDTVSYGFATISSIHTMQLDSDVDFDQLSFELRSESVGTVLQTFVARSCVCSHQCTLDNSQGGWSVRLESTREPCDGDGISWIPESDYRDPLVCDVVRSLRLSLDKRRASLLLTRLRERQQLCHDEWAALRSVLLQQESKKSDELRTPWELLARDRVPLVDDLLPSLPAMPAAIDEREWFSPSVKKARDSRLTTVVAVSLHSIAQAVRLDKLRVARDLHRLGVLIVELCAELGWTTWIDYWTRIVGFSRSLPLPAYTSYRSSSLDEPVPEDVYDYLLDIANGTRSFDEPYTSPEIRRVALYYRILFHGCDVSQARASGDAQTNENNARKLAEEMGKSPNAHDLLARLPLAISLPFREALRECMLDPPVAWPAHLYALVGRPDLAKLYSSGRKTTDDGSAIGDQRQTFSRQLKERGQEMPNLPAICFDLFAKDHRLVDVNNMLQTNRAVAVKGPMETTSSHMDEELVAEQQKRVFVSASDRIKATSVGRAMFLFDSDPVKSAEQVRIPPVCLRIRMLSHCIVQHREPDADGVEMEWPEFHNGAAAAVRLAFGGTSVESGWIYSQTGGEFSARKAGFVYGLGLCGQLRHLGKIHAHHYLSSRHSLTSIGLLLGIAVSFVGTCDLMAKALMSIHLVHTLPAYSKPLKTTMLEQSAALVGLGYVFLGSNDRWASRMAVKAMGTDLVLTDDSQMARRECFSLSAGFALGFICLAKGRDTKACVSLEKELLPTIERLIKQFRGNRGDAEAANKTSRSLPADAFEWKPDVALTTSPATIALSLIYLRSNRADIAAKLPLPQNAAELDEIRPDILLVRTLCRAIIMWDEIEASQEWLNGTLSMHLRDVDEDGVQYLPESSQLAFWAVRTGAIFALGLRFAGSNDVNARAVLLREHHAIQRLAEQRPVRYFDKVRQQALRSAVDTLHSSLAMICAGTGDVELLRIVRRSLYKVDSYRFGNYMASTMSVGLLFLGGGRFSLLRSDLAIASLLLSFFPRFPVNAQDNRAHMQAYRHLWTLAVEERLLKVKEVGSGRAAAKVPIQMTWEADKAFSQTVKCTTPCVIPRVDKLQELRLDSDRFMPLTMSLQGNVQLTRHLTKDRTLYVLPKKAMLGHDHDPFGYASMTAQTQDIPAGLDLPSFSNLGSKGNHAQRKEALWKQSMRLAATVRSSTSRTDIHSLLRSIVSPNRTNDPSSLSMTEVELQFCMLQALVQSLREDDIDAMAMLVTFFIVARKVIWLTADSSQDVDLYRVANELQLAKRLQSQKRPSPKTATYRSHLLDRLTEMLSRRLATRLHEEPALVHSLRQYAAIVGKEEVNAWHRIELCRSIIPLSIYTTLPSLGVLKQVRLGLLRAYERGVVTTESAMAFAQEIFNNAGVECASALLTHFVDVWLTE